jgi:hypothetical protein
MFTAPRFVAIDDKLHHLQAILEAFQKLGAPCIGIHYDPAQELDRNHFRGVRGLFLDLHLIEGAASTDNRRHFAQIAQILEDNISVGGGPFVLVIWTEHAHLAADLTQYLDEKLDPERPYARPLAVLSLAKDQFINVADGTHRPAATLREAIEQALSSNSQLAALISWESDVLAAAGATLSALVGLVPAAERTTAAFPPALDGVLSRLAREAVGRPHVAADPRAAITSALAPILADRIVNQDVAPKASALWAAAVTRHNDRALGAATAVEAGQINRMLHVAVPGSETIRVSDWGSVSELPADLWTDDWLRETLGVTVDQFLREEFKLHRDSHGRCRPRVVRIGAACDHAQNRRGPLSFLFGVEIPADVGRLPDSSGEVRIPASEWSSPILVIKDGGAAFKLSVNCRFSITRTAAACQDWQARYRLREQLLMHLISHANGYVSRPGIVQL